MRKEMEAIEAARRVAEEVAERHAAEAEAAESLSKVRERWEAYEYGRPESMV